jgi:hypothetical protein
LVIGIGMEFDAQAFFDEHCEFTDDTRDCVLLKNLYALPGNKPPWKEFKRKMMCVWVNKTFLCYDVKSIGGKPYCNVYWKVAMKNTDSCVMCQGTGVKYVCEDMYMDCDCKG